MHFWVTQFLRHNRAYFEDWDASGCKNLLIIFLKIGLEN